MPTSPPIAPRGKVQIFPSSLPFTSMVRSQILPKISSNRRAGGNLIAKKIRQTDDHWKIPSNQRVRDCARIMLSRPGWAPNNFCHDFKKKKKLREINGRRSQVRPGSQNKNQSSCSQKSDGWQRPHHRQNFPQKFRQKWTQIVRGTSSLSPNSLVNSTPDVSTTFWVDCRRSSQKFREINCLAMVMVINLMDTDIIDLDFVVFQALFTSN